VKYTVGFQLATPSEIEAEAIVDLRLVRVSLGTTELVVESVDATSPEDARNLARLSANKFLDCVVGKTDSPMELVEGVSSVRRVRQEAGTAVTVTTVERTIRQSASLSLETRDANGNVITRVDPSRLGRIVVNQSDAAAYYRRGLNAADPFDRFRNFYLVAENIADKVANRVSQRQREGEALRTALRECFKSDINRLERMVREVSNLQPGQDVYAETARLLYKGVRCELNHSKASQSKKIPYDADDEREVQAVLPLMKFVAKAMLAYEEHELCS
jgi:hypothetical protein